jgi:hypothetical protein
MKTVLAGIAMLGGALAGSRVSSHLSAEERAVIALSPAFKKKMREMTGKKNPSYEEILDALMKSGLDRNVAGEYALFATDKF